jgi:hypothetical protein
MSEKSFIVQAPDVNAIKSLVDDISATLVSTSGTVVKGRREKGRWTKGQQY